MNKFVKFDPRFHVSRIPMRYSIGDLTTIRNLFSSQKDSISGSQLPILPPKTEIIDDKDMEGYLIELPVGLNVALKDFIYEALKQTEKRYQSGYDPNNSALAVYTDKRQRCLIHLQNILIKVLEQERRLGIYNLFWLSVSKVIARTIHETLLASKLDETSELTSTVSPLTHKIHLQLIFSDLLLEVLKRVDLQLQKEDEYRREYIPYFTGTKKLKLGVGFNYEFSMSIIQTQAHIIVPDMKNIPTPHLFQQILTEENKKYVSSYSNFYKFYMALKTRVEQGIRDNDRILIRIISHFLPVQPSSLSEIPVDIILFDPLVISYLSDEIKELPDVTSTENQRGLFKRRPEKLIDLFGKDTWEMILQDYLNLVDDVRKSEIICFFRDRIAFVLSSKSFVTLKPRRTFEKSELAEKITYNFNPGQKIISDLRNVTLMFLDLRGYTEVSAGNITSEGLKQNLYKFFDPTMEIIEHFHGSIKYYAGDGILAAFGSGSWRDYHGLNAVRAAIEIQKFFKVLKDEGSMIFQGMGIGIHTGLLEDAYFFLNPIDKSSTVIGFTANLTGRLSSGKTERRKQTLDLQSVFTLNEYLVARAQAMSQDSSSIVIFEEQLLKILDAIQEEKSKEEKLQVPPYEFNVSVVKGVLDNNGIALSDTTFQRIRETIPLTEVSSQTAVDYLYEDKTIKEMVLFKKAGDASFKGIEGKFPVWGVYLNRWMKDKG